MMQESSSKSSTSSILDSYLHGVIGISTLIGFLVTTLTVLPYVYYPSMGYRFVVTTLVLGSVYAILIFVIRFYLMDDRRSMTVATVVTISRGFLAVFATSIAISSIGINGAESIGWLVGTAFGMSGLLDLVDGWLARNKSVKTELGSRMDIETDALSTLFGSIIVVVEGLVSPLFLLVGLARYIYLIYFLVLYGDTDPSDDGNYQWLNQLLLVLVFASISVSMFPIIGAEISRSFLSIVGTVFVANFLRSLLASRPR